jgi:DNA mismatch repair protein MSH2
MADFPEDTVKEGAVIIEELLRTWSSSAQDGEDVMMSDGLDPDAQLEELRHYVEQFRPRIEGNAWVQSILNAF